jgi:hypothetical protein
VKIRLFLSSQIRYTRIARETLLILGYNPFLLLQRTRITLFKVGMLLWNSSQYLALPQREDDHAQLKKRCAWDSLELWQRGYRGSVEINWSLSLVLSLPNIASQREKLCLGRNHCSQTTLAHWTWSTLYVKKWYALAVKDPGLECQLESICCTAEIPPHYSIILLWREKIDFQKREAVFLTSNNHIEIWGM